jgi:methylenetetrahydrofolate dehydrogenase (NADP+)/methenyltetrahydrofolate cyclohydrolase
MIIDGKQAAEGVYVRLGATRTLSPGIVMNGSNPVTDSFVRIKEKAAARLGVQLVRETLAMDASTEDAVAAVAKLAAATDGIIVQLPLSDGIDVATVLAAIPPQKDVDGISKAPIVRPPVAEAVGEILMQNGIDPRGKRAAVVGSGRLVGAPVAALLAHLGADVHVITLGDSLEPLREADIIVSGAGQPGLITSEHIKDGVVLIDAGTSESEGKVAGDADPACASKAALFTPVPGGVGPIAVAMIFRNLYELAQK